MNSKPFFKSKTMLINAVFAVAGFVPPVRDFVAANPELVISGIGFINLLLRVVTKEKVVLF